MAITEPLHLAQDAAKGKPVLGFPRWFQTDGGVLYDAGAGASGITRPADMCGATISYPGSPGTGRACDFGYDGKGGWEVRL